MIMSMRLKKLLALSLSVSLVSTGIFVDVGMRSVTASSIKNKTDYGKKYKKSKSNGCTEKNYKSTKK